MTPDSELLRDYAGNRSEAAFAELVRRHLDLVYSAALRQVNGDAHLAQDVAQTVFTDLARKAPSLSRRPVLAGWLYTSAHFAAAKAVRAEQRRHAREQEAHVMRELSNDPESDADWARLRPVLDDAMQKLNARDREAILLRFFEKLPLADVGAKLGVNDNAARMRVERALEKLRAQLIRRGITATAGALSVALSVNAIEAAPAGLAASLTNASLAGAGGALTAVKLLATAQLQAALLSLACVAGVVAPWLVERRAEHRVQEQEILRQQAADRLARLQSENLRLAALLDRAQTASAAVASSGELLKLRGDVARLRAEVREQTLAGAATNAPATDLLQTLEKESLARARQLQQWLEEHPEEKIPELQYLSERDLIDSVYPNPLETEDHYRRAMSNVRANAELRFLDRLWPALHAYLQDHAGEFPAAMSQLAPYFKSPVEPAILDRYEIVPSRTLVPELQKAGDWVITEKAPVNETLDTRQAFGVSLGCMADERVTNRWATTR